MPLRPVVLILFEIACSSASAAHRPLSAEAVEEMNRALEGSQASVVLTEAIEREPAAWAALRDACKNAPGHGSAKFEESCDETRDCECGLTCHRGYCLGTSLRIPPKAAPNSLQARGVKVRGDTTQFELRSEALDEWRETTVPTASLERVEVLSRGRGAVEGFGLGLLIGGAFGTTLGALAGSGSNGREVGIGLYAATGAMVGLAAGAVIGLLAGVAAGHRTTFEFDGP